MHHWNVFLFHCFDLFMPFQQIFIHVLHSTFAVSYLNDAYVFLNQYVFISVQVINSFLGMKQR